MRLGRRAALRCYTEQKHRQEAKKKIDRQGSAPTPSATIAPYQRGKAGKTKQAARKPVENKKTSTSFPLVFLFLAGST